MTVPVPDLSMEYFERWLADQPLERTLSRYSSLSCPLAQCHEGKYRFGCDTIRDLDGNVLASLPPWAVKFISRWDAGKGIGGTAEEAWNLLQAQKKGIK